MKKLILLSSLLLLSFNGFAQKKSIKGSGVVSESTRQLSSDFKKIDVSNAIDVYLLHDDNLELKIKADDNIHDAIDTKIENGILHISTNKNIRTRKKLEVYVNYRYIDEIHASTAGVVKAKKDTLRAERLRIRTTTASEVELLVLSKEIEVEALTASEVELKGKAIAIEVTATTAAEVDAKKLLVNEARVRANTAAEVKVNPQKLLEARARTGADIKYYNNKLESIETDKDFSGSIDYKKN